MFRETADKLRKAASKGKKEAEGEKEEAKNEAPKAEVEVKNADDEVSMEQIVKLNLEKLPWNESLENKDSHVAKMVKGGCTTFDKYQTSLNYVLSKLEGRAEPYKGLLDIFGNDKEMALAILMQNCLQPKNNQRVDAIKNGTYVEIDSKETARDFLTTLLKKNLEHELLAAESQVNE